MTVKEVIMQLLNRPMDEEAFIYSDHGQNAELVDAVNQIYMDEEGDIRSLYDIEKEEENPEDFTPITVIWGQ